jgi:hypothetical protein
MRVAVTCFYSGDVSHLKEKHCFVLFVIISLFLVVCYLVLGVIEAYD